ncbi:MAG: ADP-ribosyl-[dinitrogen reductase] hydrolase [Candidatus Thiodiazotropha sp.]|jgi:ADP-ribosyl-[dinitrogen reductase] hydrolase
MRKNPPNIDPDIAKRAATAYLALALGDALGATTEFLTPNEIKQRYGVHNAIIGGGWLRLKPGYITDDTEMSLALGDAILKNGVISARTVAEAFSDWMRKKPIDIGNTVRRGIIQFRNTGRPWVDENQYDAGNGACMRALPIAIRYHNSPIDTVVVACKTQAHTTHNNPLSDAGSETVLKMVVASLKGAEKTELQQLAEELVKQHPEFRFDKRRVENPSGYIVETLQVVFQAIFNNDGFEATLIDVVNRGGDADTTGAIAGMIAGAFYGPTQIPKRWIKKLNSNVKKQCEKQTYELLTLAGQYPGIDS